MQTWYEKGCNLINEQGPWVYDFGFRLKKIFKMIYVERICCGGHTPRRTDFLMNSERKLN
jgi:hypothetical protein